MLCALWFRGRRQRGRSLASVLSSARAVRWTEAALGRGKAGFRHPRPGNCFRISSGGAPVGGLRDRWRRGMRGFARVPHAAGDRAPILHLTMSLCDRKTGPGKRERNADGLFPAAMRPLFRFYIVSRNSIQGRRKS
jgi:hypothetical protein